MSRRDRYLKFELETSIGIVRGSIHGGSILVDSPQGSFHGWWSTERGLAQALAVLPLRDGERQELAHALVRQWTDHEKRRKDRNRRTRRRRSPPTS